MPEPEIIQLPNGTWETRKDFNFWRRAYYNTFFSTPENQAVFHDLLKELCYFRTVNTEEEKYLSNFAKKLLSWCGELSMTMDQPKECVLNKIGLPVAPSINRNPDKKEDILDAMLTGRKR